MTSHCIREGGLAINQDRCCSMDLWLSLEERRLVFSSRNQCPALHKGGALLPPLHAERGDVNMVKFTPGQEARTWPVYY